MSASPEDYSVPVAVADIPSGGRDIVLTPDAPARAAIARVLGLPAVAALEARLALTPFGRDGLSVDGDITARLTQICVVTSDAFESTIEAPVDIRFSPDGVDPNGEVDLAQLLDETAEDPPDLLVGGRVDLGAVVTEFLALALDPYPRKPGVVFEEAEDDASASPFAALRGLRQKD